MNGVVNKQNVRTWDAERPNEHKMVVINNPGVMTWVAASKDLIMGSYIFNNVKITGERYRTMLIHFAFPRFRLLHQDYMFQRESAPPHFANRVRDYLIIECPNNWIGKGGLVSWPLGSSNLTPCDFFLFKHLKPKI